MNTINKRSQTFNLVRSLAVLGLTALLTLDSARANANNSPSTAFWLPLNRLSGQFGISERGENDYYSFDVTSWGNLTVLTEGSTDTFGYLLNAGYGWIASNNDMDPGFNRNFRLTAVVGPGKYYVRVHHYDYQNGTGPYNLRTTFTPSPPDDHGNTANGGTGVALARENNTASVSGNIQYDGDVDWFRVSVKQNSGVLSATSTGTTDVVGQLSDSSGRELAWNDDSSGTVNFSVAAPVNAGTYFLKVRHYETVVGRGAYGVKFLLSPNPAVWGKHRALVVGISDYSTIKDLRFADADAQAMASLLGQRTWSVWTLIGREATKAAIESQLRWLSSGSGEQFLFYFAGHGSTGGGTNGRLCPWDTKGKDTGSMISANELNTWLSNDGFAQTAVILDASIGGNGSDGTRSWRPDVYSPDYRASEVFARSVALSGKNRVVWTACQGNQGAYERSSWGHGWFTWKLLSAFSDIRLDISGNYNTAISIQEALPAVGQLSNPGSDFSIWDPFAIPQVGGVVQSPGIYGSSFGQFDVTRF